MISYIDWLWYHRLGGYDETDPVHMRSVIVDLMSYIKWCDVLKSGCDVMCSAYDVIHIVAVMSCIQWV